MIIVRYATYGQALTDADVPSFIQHLISLNEQTGRAYADVGNFLVIDAMRAAIAEGQIAHGDVTIKFGDETIEFDQYAFPLNKMWPEGFNDPYSGYTRKLILARANKYKLEKAL